MTVKQRGLGRGLGELLSGTQLPELLKPDMGGEAPGYLAIHLLEPGKYQPRREIDPAALEELADSIRAQGILQPILVRPIAMGHRYEIIAGERRWRAAQLALLDKVPVFVREISDEAAVAMSLIENIQREDLNAIEQAVALKRLGEEFTLTHEEIAHAVGKSRVTVSNLLRLLQLEPTVSSLLEKGALEMGHARALLGLSSSQQVSTAHTVVAKGLSVRATEELVRKSHSSAVASSLIGKKTDPDTLRLQSELSDKLAAVVKINHQRNGKGKLVIHYHSLDELDGILERIR